MFVLVSNVSKFACMQITIHLNSCMLFSCSLPFTACFIYIFISFITKRYIFSYSTRVLCFFVCAARAFRLFVPWSSEKGVDHKRVLFMPDESNCGVIYPPFVARELTKSFLNYTW
uniref:Uncharacterized protein n=1 Tax=Arundo donax TaxID=35708 RepID=A0A0A9DNA7_ARUDO